MWVHGKKIRKTASIFHRGSTVVELAVVIPILLTLVFGIIEFGWVMMVEHTVGSAAREGCRMAALVGTGDSDINAKIDGFMSGVGIPKANYTVTITHATTADPTETVTVKVLYSKISLLKGYFKITDFYLTGRAAMHKEGM